MGVTGAASGCRRFEGAVSAAQRRPLVAQRMNHGKEACDMPGNVYKFIELVGTSSESWEKAAANAIEVASKTLRDLRIAEVSELDMQLENGKIIAYRVKVKLSFKIESL
jgi:flavin-binding protein dodecin